MKGYWVRVQTHRGATGYRHVEASTIDLAKEIAKFHHKDIALCHVVADGWRWEPDRKEVLST